MVIRNLIRQSCKSIKPEVCSQKQIVPMHPSELTRARREVRNCFGRVRGYPKPAIVRCVLGLQACRSTSSSGFTAKSYLRLTSRVNSLGWYLESCRWQFQFGVKATKPQKTFAESTAVVNRVFNRLNRENSSCEYSRDRTARWLLLIRSHARNRLGSCWISIHHDKSVGRNGHARVGIVIIE